MQITTIISTAYDSTKRLLVKVRRFGKSDIQTPFQANPFGVDSNPIKGMKAIYSNTSEAGKNVIVGYINEDNLSEAGETRLYSTDENGVLKTYIWLKKNGDILLGGDTGNVVKYTELNLGLQQFKIDMQAELVKIAAGISAGGGSYSPATLSIDIADSKVNKVKV